VLDENVETLHRENVDQHYAFLPKDWNFAQLYVMAATMKYIPLRSNELKPSQMIPISKKSITQNDTCFTLPVTRARIICWSQVY